VFLRDLSARRNLEYDLERRNCILSTRRETSIDAVLLVDVNVRISALRIRIFIDGFGTVYCSPRKIATLPINALKIDRSFVLGTMRHERRRAVDSALIFLAHTLGCKVVAEGFESADRAQPCSSRAAKKSRATFSASPCRRTNSRGACRIHTQVDRIATVATCAVHGNCCFRASQPGFRYSAGRGSR